MLFVLITAFHDIPSTIYHFYVVLNVFHCIIVLLVDIAGIFQAARSGSAVGRCRSKSWATEVWVC